MQKRFFFRLAFGLFVLPLLLAGCGDTISFTRRTAALVRPPPEATVVGAIKAVPGVVLEPTRKVSPNTDWGLYTGVEHNQGGQMYSYHSADADGNVSVTHTQADGWTLSVSSAWMGGRPTAEWLQKSQRLNDRVYLSLRQRYPALPPLDQTKEEGMRP